MQTNPDVASDTPAAQEHGAERRTPVPRNETISLSHRAATLYAKEGYAVPSISLQINRSDRQTRRLLRMALGPEWRYKKKIAPFIL